MAGNNDSGKPRILPGMTISPMWEQDRGHRLVKAPIKLKPIPKAQKKTPTVKPIPRAPVHRRGSKRSKRAGMFREDI